MLLFLYMLRYLHFFISIVEDLVARQHVHADTVADVGLVATCLAVRSGASKPLVGDHEELRSTLLSADEIHMGDPERSTGGIHFAGVLSRLGIGDQVRGHLHTFPNGVTAMTAQPKRLAIEGEHRLVMP